MVPKRMAAAVSGRIHHHAAGAPRSVLDALHVLEGRDGSALVSAAYHDLVATQLLGSELHSAIVNALAEMHRSLRPRDPLGVRTRRIEMSARSRPLRALAAFPGALGPCLQ